MTLRIAVGGLMHETNTFVSTPTTYEDFARGGAWPVAVEGDALPPAVEGLNLAIAGFIAEARRAGHVIIPTAWACAQPSGIVTRDAFERMAGMVLRGLGEARPDAVFIELHGAMVVEGYEDGDAELLRRVRAAVGEGVPVLALLDLHANVSRAMLDHADFLTSYRTYPHVDWGATGTRAAQWLDRVVAWRGRGGKAFRQAGFLVPITTGCTLTEPSAGLYARLAEIEEETGIALSINMGFPPSDIPDAGPSVLAFGDDPTRVEEAADRMFEAFAAAEPGFAAHRPLSAEEAVTEAIRLASNASRPVVVADTQDNPGAGAPSNTTGLIAELLRQGATGVVVGNFHDPALAASAHAAGVGGALPTFGGGGEGPGQDALPGPWTVTALSDGIFQGTAPMLRAKDVRMGPTALLRRNGVEVLVGSVRMQPIHRETFTHLGRDPREARIVVLKSSAHFRAGFQDIAERVIVALSPGANPEDPAALPFTRLRPGMRLRPASE